MRPCLSRLLLFVLFVSPLVSEAAVIKEVRLAPHDGYARCVVESDIPLEYTVQPGKNSVVIEFRSITGAPEVVRVIGDRQVVTEERLEADKAHSSCRLTLKSGGDLRVDASTMTSPVRTVFDLYPSTSRSAPSAPSTPAPEVASAATATPVPSPAPSPKATSVAAAPPARSTVKTIVIDPGHGGYHKGGLGQVNGRTVAEKEITIAIGFKVEKLFQQDPRFRVALTRRDDTYVGLEERTRRAEAAKGDLFVSIHTNAVVGKAAQQRAKGIEFWTWNQNGNAGAAARALQELENDEGRNSASSRNTMDILNGVMRDALESQATDSVRLAQAMEGSFTRQAYFRSNYRGTDSARFKVLENYSMPSVLIEVGFITHPDEVRKLVDPAFQQQVAQDIYDGVVRYYEVSDASFRAGAMLASRR